MKKHLLLPVLCAFLTIFASCEKKTDETTTPDEPKTTNVIKYNGQTINIAFAKIERGIVGGYTDKTTKDISFSAMVSGKMYELILEVVFPTDAGISGDYRHLFSIDQEEDGVTHFLHDMFSSFRIDDITMENPTEHYDFTSADVKIKDKGNNNYDITFKLVCDNGKTVEGNYSGIVNSGLLL